ncbi:MAG: hypothetical protein ABC378_03190 [Staphylococcus pseudoxylosus]|uniref:hypothetical protein n=1 Tax=Staphylococcus pseudoxylosus TaxID=2282419 RepID=UPI0031F5F6AF
MKKFLFLLLTSFLVLAACGQEDSKSEDKKETKSSSKEVEKDNDKKIENDDKENADKNESKDKNNEEVTSEKPQSQEQFVQENEQEQDSAQYQERVNTQESQNTQENSNDQANVPAGDVAFGEYKDDGTYCTVGGCLTPEQQKNQEELNYEEMENQGYSREEYDAIQDKEAELQQQRNNGEISTEEFSERYLELYD